jgi:hypothetical protein
VQNAETVNPGFNPFVSLLILFLLILVNAFFAASEIAIITLNDNKIRKMAEDGDKKAEKNSEADGKLQPVSFYHPNWRHAFRIPDLRIGFSKLCGDSGGKIELSADFHLPAARRLYRTYHHHPVLLLACSG